MSSFQRIGGTILSFTTGSKDCFIKTHICMQIIYLPVSSHNICILVFFNFLDINYNINYACVTHLLRRKNMFTRTRLLR